MMRKHYQLPTMEDVSSRLSGAQVFSILDVKQGFWHIKLDEASSMLTTFNTPFGRFRWVRLPFGIASAPEVFQRSMHELVEGLQGVEVVADDFLVHGIDVRTHDANLHAFLQRCEERDVVLSSNKLQLRRSEVPFIGHLATADGIVAAPGKVRALIDMPQPTDTAGVRRFLGMVQYLSKFLPRLAEMTHPLRQLTQKDTEFAWNTAQERAFSAVKQAVSRAPVLRYYNLNDEVTVQCDASKDGLGAALMQNGQPVAYASRTLTECEQRYAQIEKECLAIVFACERFDFYLFARAMVTVETDHLPLETIFKKSLEAAPARLQKMRVRLQRYSLTVVYKRGSQMHLADMLSRAVAETTKTEQEARVHSLCRNEQVFCDPRATLMMRESNVNKVRNETAKDQVLEQLAETIRGRWPTHHSGAAEATRPYFSYQDKLTCHEGLIFKGHRLVIPKSLQKEMLEIAHGGHVGLESTLRRLREAVFWPSMTSDAKRIVDECDACQQCRQSNQREPLLSHDFATRPWSKIGMDLCQLDSRIFLIAVDYYSNYVEVVKLMSTVAKAVVKSVMEIFARFGIPDTVVTDNGPQFSGAEFEAFAKSWGFEHVTSSPRYAQSNGKAENAVKTIKNLFQKCKADHTSDFFALLNWCNTPTKGLGVSPAQRLFGRRCKTLLPMVDTLLRPRYDQTSEVLDMRRAKAKQAFYYNKMAKWQPKLETGDQVRMRVPDGSGTDKLWSAGEVVGKVAPRSFQIRVGETVFRRNRRHLLRQSSKLDHQHTTAEEVEPQPTNCGEVIAQPDEQREDESRAIEREAEEDLIVRRSSRVRKSTTRFGYDDDC